MDERVAVHLGCRREQKRRALCPREAEHVHRPDRADLQGVDRIRVVLRWRRGRCEVQRVAHVSTDEDAVVDVHLAKLEVRVRPERLQVVRRPGDEVVDRKHPAAAVEQSLAEV